MKHHDSSRREFLRNTAAVAGSSWAKLILPSVAAISQAACTARADEAAFSILTADEAMEFEAIAARIIPTTDTPGAREAGVIYFFDQTFGTINAASLDFARGGLAELQSAIADGRSFSALSNDEQDAFLETQQETPFFGLMRFMTLCGFFGMNKYGGNKDGIGWKLVGMDPRIRSYTSPFGYYDAEYMKENPSG